MLGLGVVLAGTFAASLVITPLVVRLARFRGLYDVPSDGRRVHSRPIPRIGGVAVFASMVVGLCLVLMGFAGDGLPSETSYIAGILVGGAIMFGVGLWDDLRGISAARKLIAQCVAASVVFAFGFRIEVLSLGSTAELELGWVALPLTAAWVVAVTNAFNLIDGLDGLATGLAVVALGTILVVSLTLGNLEVAVVCAVLLGSLLGFLRYNFNPARIFLGDSGSLFVGFMLAVLSVHGSMKSAAAVLVIVPLFTLALPLLDTALTVGRRWLRGVPLAVADAHHIHHRLLALGLTHRTVVLVLYLVATALAIFGVSLAFAPPTTVFGVAVAGGAASVVILLYGVRHLEYHEFMEAGAVLASGARRVRRLIRDQILARDAASAILHAASLHEVREILRRNASHFGFLSIDLCRETASTRRQIAALNGEGARAWKLDYPVMPRRSADDDPFVLRIWCDSAGANRPYGAERIARILGPSIEGWLHKEDSPVEVLVIPARGRPRAAEATVIGGFAAAPVRELSEQSRFERDYRGIADEGGRRPEPRRL